MCPQVVNMISWNCDLFIAILDWPSTLLYLLEPCSGHISCISPSFFSCFVLHCLLVNYRPAIYSIYGLHPAFIHVFPPASSKMTFRYFIANKRKIDQPKQPPSWFPCVLIVYLIITERIPLAKKSLEKPGKPRKVRSSWLSWLFHAFLPLKSLEKAGKARKFLVFLESLEWYSKKSLESQEVTLGFQGKPGIWPQ